MKKVFALLAVMLMTALGPIYAHCQVPCGIYTDDLRFSIMNEHAETLMKSMKQIVELSKAAKPDMNQIVRWTTTKDSHADDIINICAQYFLCQRIKPAKDAKNEKEQNAYLNKLELVHKLMITAMKCKQGTDTKNVDELKKLIHDFSVAYEGAAHKHKH